jgi:hypothetical protein
MLGDNLFPVKTFPKLSGFFLVLATVLFSFTSAQAKNPVFHFQVGNNDQLSVHPADNPNGPAIAKLVPGDIGKRVSAPPYVFLVSYGHDANGHLSIIVTPEPDNPTDLTFDFNGRTIDMDNTSAVTITVLANGKVVIDPGVVGVVRVDGHVAQAPTANTPNPSNPNNTPGMTSAVVTTDSPGDGNQDGYNHDSSSTELPVSLTQQFDPNAPRLQNPSNPGPTYFSPTQNSQNGTGNGTGGVTFNPQGNPQVNVPGAPPLVTPTGAGS